MQLPYRLPYAAPTLTRSWREAVLTPEELASVEGSYWGERMPLTYLTIKNMDPDYPTIRKITGIGSTLGGELIGKGGHLAYNGYEEAGNYLDEAYNRLADRYNNWQMQRHLAEPIQVTPQTSLTGRKLVVPTQRVPVIQSGPDNPVVTYTDFDNYMRYDPEYSDRYNMLAPTQRKALYDTWLDVMTRNSDSPLYNY